MKPKKPSLYDAQELQIQKQTAGFLELLTRKGMVEDARIDSEKVRKAQKETAQKAYHNTQVLLGQYRLIIWVLSCVPGEIAQELYLPVGDVDALASKLDMELALENKRVESRLSAMMKTRFLVDRIHEALSVLKKKPGNGDQLYDVLYVTYIDPVERKHDEILKHLQMTSRTYYRLRKEALMIMSIRLWSAPSGDIESWLEVLTILQGL